MSWLAKEFDMQEKNEVDKVETVTTAATHITNVPYNFAVAEEISCPSPDLVRAQEDRPRCPSSCEKTMNKGHR